MNEVECCSAVTGKSTCEFFWSTCHRCRLRPDHPNDYTVTEAAERVVHVCECGHRWTCLTGSVDELIDILRVPGGQPDEEQERASAAGA